MTGRPVFGDFLDAAHGHLAEAGRLPATYGGVDIRQASTSMLRILVLMHRYVLDVTPGSVREPPRGQRAAAGWTRAGTETREALARAAAFLNQPDAPRPGQHAAGGELAWHLDAASASLAAGRDLLQTHLARDRDGERQLRSQWGLVVTSPAVARAVLTEMGALARRLAPLGAGLALGPGSHGSREERQKLNAACQWLWIVDSRVAAAQRREPVPGSDLELLRAIPPRMPPPRRLPAPAETVAGLCAGVINSAERVRHLAWETSSRPASSPRPDHQLAAPGRRHQHPDQPPLRNPAPRPGRTRNRAPSGRPCRRAAAGSRSRRAHPATMARGRSRARPGHHRHPPAPLTGRRRIR